jgi:hypothetical protein
MLSEDKYTQEYIDECRSRVADQVSAYQIFFCSSEKSRREG